MKLLQRRVAPTAAELSMAARTAKEAATAEQVPAELAADQLDEDEIMATNMYCITEALSTINTKFAIGTEDMTITLSPGVSRYDNRVLWCVAMMLWFFWIITIANYACAIACEILCEE